MALMIQLQWPKFGYKRATLFGEGRIAISLTNLGPLCIIKFDVSHARAFSEFLKTNLALEEYLAEHAPAVRLAKKRAQSRAKLEAREWAQADIEYWRDAYHREAEKAAKYSSENLKMSYAIDVLSKQRAALGGQQEKKG
jgi:hypothetical protein